MMDDVKRRNDAFETIIEGVAEELGLSKDPLFSVMLFCEDINVWKVASAHFWVPALEALHKYEAPMFLVILSKNGFQEVFAGESSDHRQTLPNQN